MQDFEVRRASLFASLDSAANEIGHKLRTTNVSNVHAINHHDNAVSVNEHALVIEHEEQPLGRRGRNSIFLRPEAPITRCLRSAKVPDYQRNPHKWKKYSLADADDSDVANRVGALMFLQKISRERQNMLSIEADAPAADLNDKIEFRKRKHNDLLLNMNSVEGADAQLDNPQIKMGKLVMPEYVIGQQVTKKKQAPNKAQSKRAAGNLILAHLQEDEEEEEEEEE